MESRVQKWGNSLAVRIPRAFAAEMSLEEGSEVHMDLDGDSIRLRPVRPPAYRLADLLSGITPDNLHGEEDLGPPAGNEIW